ncbi:MAG: transglutaminaseTgpA domain-containing protein [Propionibacteriaceae bacterium]|nr:transglutaminaseTgpA domain-containing protein [Propionibacteriaceae bacterium]
MSTNVAAPSTGAPTRNVLTTAVTVLLLIALHVPGVVAFGPVFNGPPGWIAAGGGVLLGVAVGALATRFRMGAALTAAAGLLAYLIFGAALALPTTAIARIIPTLDSLQRLALLTFQSWRDLLTVTTPVDSLTGPAVVPYLSGLICGLLAVTLALRTRRPLLALIPPLLLLVIAIAFGMTSAFWPGLLAAGFLIAAVAYAAWVRQRTEADGPATLVTASGHRARLLPGLLAALVALGLVAAVGAWAGPLIPGGDRHVLRTSVEPPLDLRDYASPLTNYRYWQVDLAEESLFTVTGLPENARLRLATLDTFDGIVYNVARDSASFVRSGGRMAGDPVGQRVTLNIEVGEYAGIWLPGVGEWRSVTFPDDATASVHSDTLYHSQSTSTTLTTAGIAAGDQYQVTADVVTPAAREALADAKPASDQLPPAAQTPDAISRLATDFAGTEGTPVERLTRLEGRLQEGFYSNGQDGKSRAGHTTERIATLLDAPQLIGDDEQYAVAMALMARDLGYPARVVLGFYPEPDTVTPGGAWSVRGADAHAWVEVDFGTHGWVTFDPTPDRDRVPTTDVPRPQPQPQPQVPPPPQPPPADVDEQPDINASDRSLDDKRDFSALWAVLRVIGIVVGIAAAVAAPFLGIALAKRQRRNRRRTGGRIADQATGAWDEFVDLAIDHGVRPPKHGTRLQEARALADAHPALPILQTARLVDDQVYGPQDPAAADVDDAWNNADDMSSAIRQSLPRWRRIVGFCSLRSFWQGRGVQRGATEGVRT